MRKKRHFEMTFPCAEKTFKILTQKISPQFAQKWYQNLRKTWHRNSTKILRTSFFARGQRAFKLVRKSIKEEEGGGREERRRKEKEEERKKCEKENIKADEKIGSSDANGKIAARVRARGRVDERDRG